MVEMSLHEFMGIINLVGDFIEHNKILNDKNFKSVMLRINDADRYGKRDINLGMLVENKNN